MKYLLVILLILPANPGKAQPGNTYESLVAKASLAHLQRKYKQAIQYFDQAFAIRKPDQLNAYKAAGAFALDSNITRSFYYLQAALDSGWVDAGWIDADPYFDLLKKEQPEKWASLLSTATQKEKEFSRSIRIPSVRSAVNSMARKDQELRYKRAQTMTRTERKQLDRQIYAADSANRADARQIIQKFGFPGIDEIGSDGQNNLWLIIQHADDDVLLQSWVLRLMQEKMPAGKIRPDCYAFLYDRVQCNLNYKQVYGTQVNWLMDGEASGFRRIIREDSTDLRRATLGLEPLSVYALNYGFSYEPVSAIQAKQEDSADIAYTATLIDSAMVACSQKKYGLTYDLYNTASTVMGGMSDADNYNAAVVFAKIAKQDSDPKYGSIALDFLNLLCLRRTVSKEQLLKQKEFSILHKEERWKNLFELLRKS